MSDAFISYRRKPSAPQASLLQEKLKNRHNIDAYLDTTRTDSTRVQFPERLMGAIEEAPTFILMLGDTTLESEWVLKEIQRAYDLKKHCIPVFQESYAPTNSTDPAVNYVLNFDGVHLFDVKNIMIDESVANIARLIIRKTPIQPEPVSMIESRVKIAPKAGVMLGGVMVILVIMALIVLAVLNGANQPVTPTPDLTHTPESVALVTDELSPTASETVTTQSTDTATIELSPTPQPTQTDILSITPEQLALTPVARNEDWIPFERDFDGVTMVLVPVGSFVMGSTPEETDYAYNQCMEIYGNCSRDWFDRSLISENHTQNILKPFWIDKYEVSQSQFIRFDGQKEFVNTFIGDDLPVESITWFEAHLFCELRGGRLPSELEWEYVVRGPSNLIYSWGNEFDGKNTNFCDENCQLNWRYTNADDGYATTAPIDSYPEGVSWVGAYQMIGNVWEWTSSTYSEYPYNIDTEVFNNDAILRSIRGGSWITRLAYMPSFIRARLVSPNRDNDVGFRCVRDFEG